MPLINLHNCYLRKLTGIDTICLTVHGIKHMKPCQREGGRRPSILLHRPGFYFSKVGGCQETVNTTEKKNSFDVKPMSREREQNTMQ